MGSFLFSADFPGHASVGADEDDQMRIAFIMGPLDLSGGVKVIMTYAHELTRRGHEVTIVSIAHPKRPLKDKLKNLLKGNGWPSLPKTFEVNKQINHIKIDTNRPVMESDVPDCDVVIATWWRSAEWVNGLSSAKGRKFYFVQHHEVFPYLPPRSRDTYRFPLKKIVVSKWLKDTMLSEYGDDDVTLVPNTVDRLQLYASRREKNKCPTVGVLYSTAGFKGVATAFEAIERVRERIPNLRLVSFGSERPKSHLRLPRNSTFYLRPAQHEIRNIYGQCDAWLTCSTTEGFNLPALEAMSCGTPVVSTRAGWCVDGIVDRVNGRLADTGDVATISDCLEWVLNRPEDDWASLSKAAERTMTTVSWQESADMFEKVLIS